ncbi:MAG: porin family protein [Luteibaculaceae bacterium]
MYKNKRIYSFSVFLLFLLVTAEPILAQRNEFRLGFNLGGVASQVRGDNSSGFNQIGLHVGAFVDYEIDRDFFFEVGLNFIQKGSRDNQLDNAVAISDYNLRLNYIEAPFMLRYHFLEKLYLSGGLTVGALIGYSEINNNIQVNDPRDFARIEFGYLGTVGYKLSEKVMLQIGYHGSINKVRERDAPQMLQQRNQVVSLGFRLIL